MIKLIRILYNQKYLEKEYQTCIKYIQKEKLQMQQGDSEKNKIEFVTMEIIIFKIKTQWIN